MNEQIKRLAVQAGFISGVWAPDNVAAINCKAELEKFAELIVRECADAADATQIFGCNHVGDYVGEHMGYGTEEGIANWRNK